MPFPREVAVPALAAALLLIAPASGPAQAQSAMQTATPFGASQNPGQNAKVDPLALYGQDLRFRIMRKGERVGTHRVSFSHDGKTVIARAHADIEIKLAFIPIYRFSYSSTTTWARGQIQSLRARTDDNGTDTSVAVDKLASGQLGVSGSGGPATVAADTFPTDHWNPAVIGSDRVINTITGEINDVTLTRIGRERVETGTGPREADHYRYTGQLEAEVWYDDQGRWVKLAFPGRDGSRVDYICESCGSGEAMAARPAPGGSGGRPAPSGARP
ncbi:hypothetical protein CKO38_09895 [Rhodospirillum rubrum]|uniref:DUF6134 family protein n=1 Tax=Rhodospirillum rubrum TaxID=1085 RepID=UPI001905B46E|nr:DUF6134 family protein [Rhodospirillum rubrum]MBK1663646.1 hypothetical protein [Rhodospirillum rubrum]MBK1676972.1 hypothetical protein [Rhodospirillum rubrum]